MLRSVHDCPAIPEESERRVSFLRSIALLAHALEGLLERGEDALHGGGRGVDAHDADAPHLAGGRAEAAGDLDLVSGKIMGQSHLKI